MASYNANSSSSVDNHRLSAVASLMTNPNDPVPIQDTPKPATAKRSSSVGAAFRSMFTKRSDVLETVPIPWTGSFSNIDIAQAIETQNRAHSAESSFPNSPQDSAPGVGQPQQQQQLRGRPTTLITKSSSPAARFFTPSLNPDTKPLTHTEGVIKDGSPRSMSSSAMAMQSHRGGHIEVAKATATSTNYSGAGT